MGKMGEKASGVRGSRAAAVLTSTPAKRGRPNSLLERTPPVAKLRKVDERVLTQKLSQEQRASSSAGPLPVLLVTGFLGAGKTTLVNSLLQHRGSIKAAVFVNEFGEVDVDGEFLRWQSGIQRNRVLTLKDGCICCGGKDDLANVIHEELDSVRKELDILIIETSGITNPRPVLETLRTVPSIQVVSTLCVVDSTTVGDKAFGASVEAQAQITTADVVALSKTDLLGSSPLESSARFDATKQKILEDCCRLGRCSAPDIAAATSSSIKLATFCSLRQGPQSRVRHKDNDQFEKTAMLLQHDRPLHKETFATHTFCVPRAFDRSRFEAWAASPPPGILRAKGFLQVAGSSKPMIWHLAGHVGSMLQEVDWCEHEADSNKQETPEVWGSEIVLIGRYGDDWIPAEFEAMLKSCLAAGHHERN